MTPAPPNQNAAALERYERELAGTGFITRSPDGWDFDHYAGTVEQIDDHEYHLCLSRRTAQFDFALDEYLAVYVREKSWLKLYNSVFDLVRLEKLFSHHLPKGPGPVKISPLGHHDSIVAFEGAHVKLLGAFEKIGCDGDDQNAIYHRTDEVIKIGRFYDGSTFSLYAIHYLQLLEAR